MRSEIFKPAQTSGEAYIAEPIKGHETLTGEAAHDTGHIALDAAGVKNPAETKSDQEKAFEPMHLNEMGMPVGGKNGGKGMGSLEKRQRMYAQEEFRSLIGAVQSRARTDMLKNGKSRTSSEIVAGVQTEVSDVIKKYGTIIDNMATSAQFSGKSGQKKFDTISRSIFSSVQALRGNIEAKKGRDGWQHGEADALDAQALGLLHGILDARVDNGVDKPRD